MIVNLKIGCEHIAWPLVNPLQMRNSETLRNVITVAARHTARPLVNVKIGCEHRAQLLVNPL